VAVDWPQLLGRLVGGSSLTREEAADALAEMLTGEVDPARIAAFLTALTAKGETTDEMIGFVDAMLAAANTFEAPAGTMDIVGTGGDQLHTVNLSTMAALTVAGCGVKVAKHGNRAASSSVGTADVLEALGVKIDVDADAVLACIDEAGIGFCFAQRFHAGLRHLGPIRRQLGFPTIFNVLGPLANPARVTRMLVGVANDAMIERMAHVLAERHVEHAILVHAEDGLDELSLGSVSIIYDVRGDEVNASRLDPASILGTRHVVAELVGGDVVTNVGAMQEYLAATPGPIFDTATANAGLALVAAGRADTLEDGVALAQESVRSGAARQALETLVAVSNRS
jgi:anthranilate phosphoribosyltransferase